MVNVTPLSQNNFTFSSAISRTVSEIDGDCSRKSPNFPKFPKFLYFVGFPLELGTGAPQQRPRLRIKSRGKNGEGHDCGCCINTPVVMPLQVYIVKMPVKQVILSLTKVNETVK